MPAFHELVAAFRQLQIEPDRPVIAHASLSAFGHIPGGAQTLLGALLSVFSTVVMPTFTYKTMLTPGTGPASNGLAYGAEHDRNTQAEFFQPQMPADRLMGAVPEALRRHPRAQRSLHPILSFAGIQAGWALESQTRTEPLAPIQRLWEAGGWVLLIGVNHTVNTSIHLGERLAGRKQFVRWALTPAGVVECPGFPGCSDGFEALAPQLEPITRRVQVGIGQIQALPLPELIQITMMQVSADAQSLLCNRAYCERCPEVRAALF